MQPQENDEDLIQKTWDAIEPKLTYFFRNYEEGLGYPSYMNLYTLVYNFCIKSKTDNRLNWSQHKGVAMLGVELFFKVSEFFTLRLNEIQADVSTLSGDKLLERYAFYWKRSTGASLVMNRLFEYLNRHWIKREVDEGTPGIFPIHTLFLVKWRDIVFSSLDEKIVNSAFELVHKHRLGENIQDHHVKILVDSLVDINYKKGSDTVPSIDLYRSQYEAKFIAETIKFYTLESETFINDHGMVEYLKKAEKRLNEEDGRANMFLRDESRYLLKAAVEQTMIKDHKAKIEDIFLTLLANDENRELELLVSLLSRIPDGLDETRKRFEEFVKDYGLKALSHLAGSSEESKEGESKQYIDCLLQVHSKYLSLIVSSLKNDTGFITSFDKSPEFLARHCDSLLTKGSRNLEESELEEELTQIMILFRYIEDKDVFQQFYSRRLAKRLINSTSVSEDIEASMISKLKETCGYDYTTKLQRMFTDVGISRDINAQYRTFLQTANIELGVDLYVMVLGTGAWPLNPPSSSFTLPSVLESSLDRFLKFYQNKHSGRKLKWLHQYSRAEIKAVFPASKTVYLFQVSTCQLAILLHYNQKDGYKYSELSGLTLLSDDLLQGYLGILTSAKVLIVNDEKSTDPTYSINLNYRNKKIKMNLNKPIRSEQKAESEDTHKTVEEDRKLVIQACIVRIMKTRKVMKHVQLMNEVISQLQVRFKPKVTDIKKCIDILIDKEYISRDEKEKDLFNYVA